MLDNLDGVNGFGMGSASELENLSKALEAGYAVDPQGQSNGGAFRVESLENSLKVLTYTDQHVQLWKRIPKKKATNTVEEYNQLISYGSEGGGFIPEGQLPDTEDSVYQRQAAFVKFLGTTREVSHQMTLVNSAHGDVIARYNQDGILWLLKKLEHGLFHGDSKLNVGGREGVEFDGLDKMIAPENTVDLRGKHLEEKHINYGAQMIVENYGIPTHLFVPMEVQAQFSEQFFPKERVIMPTQAGYQAGLVVNKFQTHGGPVEFVPDVFLKKTKPCAMKATSAKAPAMPSGVVLNATTGGNALAEAGAYKVAVALANRHGESAPFVVEDKVTIEAGGAIQITVTNPAVTQFPVEHMVIYRSEVGKDNLFQVARVPVSTGVVNGTTTVTDTLDIMANTYTAFMGQMSEDVLAFKQLAPLMKMDLATLAPSYRWMILLYGMPVLYAPNKFMRFTNIKSEMYTRDIM